MSCTGASTCRRTAGSTSTRTRSATSPTPSPPTARFNELRVLVEGEVETQDTDGVVRGAVERFPPSCYLRETPLTAARRRDRRLRRALARGAGDDPLQAPARPARAAARRDDLRHRPDPGRPPPRPKPSRSSAASARTSPISSSRRRAASASRRAMSAAISTATTASSSRRPATPGPRPSCPTSAGSPSTPPTASARPTPMCGSRSASTISAPRRCAAPATAAAARRSTSRSASTRSKPAPKPELRRSLHHGVDIGPGGGGGRALGVGEPRRSRLATDMPRRSAVAVRRHSRHVLMLAMVDVGGEFPRRVQHAQLLGRFAADAVALGLLDFGDQDNRRGEGAAGAPPASPLPR